MEGTLGETRSSFLSCEKIDTCDPVMNHAPALALQVFQYLLYCYTRHPSRNFKTFRSGASSH